MLAGSGDDVKSWMGQRSGRVVLLGTLLAALGVSACQGCRPTAGLSARGAPSSAEVETQATLRLYLLSNVAGALEPCGCTKDQLGGVDRLGALIASRKREANASLLIAAGPMAFGDFKLEPARARQDEWKAETLAGALADLGLGAWTPGYNDWAGGSSLLARIANENHVPLVAGNLKGENAGAVASVLRDLGGGSLKLGIVGVSMPNAAGDQPTGIVVEDPAPAMKNALADLRGQGANVLVGVAAMPRGEALRLAESVAGLSVLVVGKPSDGEDANDAAPPAQLIGSTLVVETSNHLQTVGVVDLFVRGNDYAFQDGSGIRERDEVASLDRRIADLTTRIGSWEKEGTLPAAEIAKKKIDRDNLVARRNQAAAPPPAPAKGSYFRYHLIEVRDSLGRDAPTHERMRSFYRRVNEHNKVAFQGRKPPVPAAGESSYVGVDSCGKSDCHPKARKVWEATKHSHAYETLANDFKEYNLECVSCHVTGYEQPGGSTVTMTAGLRGVQCESCHGPGSEHVKAPNDKAKIPQSPKLLACAESCHHPPHVEGFDIEKRLPLVLGPGHGKPEDDMGDDAGAVAPK